MEGDDMGFLNFAGRLLRLFLIRATLVALLWFGVVKEMGGPGNVFALVSWVLAVGGVGVMVGIEDSIKKHPGPVMPAQAYAVFDGAMLGALVWFGWWWTALAWFAIVCVTQSWFKAWRVEKKRRATEKARAAADSNVRHFSAGIGAGE
jgi:hypothetical protein